MMSGNRVGVYFVSVLQFCAAASHADFPSNSMTSYEGIKQNADAAFRASDYSQAIALYGQCITLQPENGTLFSNRSLCYYQLKDFQSSLDDAKACISLRPDWYKGYCRVAAALLGLGQFEEALMRLHGAHVAEVGAATEYIPLARKIVSQCMESNPSFIFDSKESQKMIFICVAVPSRQALVWKALFNILNQYTEDDAAEHTYASVRTFILTEGVESMKLHCEFMCAQPAAGSNPFPGPFSFTQWSDETLYTIRCLHQVCIAMFHIANVPENRPIFSPYAIELKAMHSPINGLLRFIQSSSYTVELPFYISYVQSLYQLIFELIEIDPENMFRQFWIDSTCLMDVLACRFHDAYANEFVRHDMFRIMAQAQYLTCKYVSSSPRISSLQQTKLRSNLETVAALMHATGHRTELRSVCSYFLYFAQLIGLLLISVDEYNTFMLFYERIIDRIFDAINWHEMRDAEDGFNQGHILKIGPAGQPTRCLSGVSACFSTLQFLVHDMVNDPRNREVLQDTVLPLTVRGLRYWIGNSEGEELLVTLREYNIVRST